MEDTLDDLDMVPEEAYRDVAPHAEVEHLDAGRDGRDIVRERLEDGADNLVAEPPDVLDALEEGAAIFVHNGHLFNGCSAKLRVNSPEDVL